MWTVIMAAALAAVLMAVHVRGRLRDARRGERKVYMVRALALAAVLMAAGCAPVHPPSAACPEVRFPPAVYLQDVHPPVFRGTTNADLAEYVLELRNAVDRSNLDKARLREFFAGP
jgi:hypothetical protein